MKWTVGHMCMYVTTNCFGCEILLQEKMHDGIKSFPRKENRTRKKGIFLLLHRKNHALMKCWLEF